MENIKEIFENKIPFAKKMGVKISQLEPGRAVLSLPEDHTNDNFWGTCHAGALFTLGDFCGAAAIAGAIDLNEVKMVTRGAKISFMKYARGEIKCLAELDEEVLEPLKNQLESGRKTTLEVKCILQNEENEPVAEMTVEYHFSKAKK